MEKIGIEPEGRFALRKFASVNSQCISETCLIIFTIDISCCLTYNSINRENIMRKFIGKVLEIVAKPFVKILDFIVERNIRLAGLVGGLIIGVGFGLTTLAGLLSVSSYLPFLAIAAALTTIPPVLGIIGYLAEKVQDFGRGLQNDYKYNQIKQDSQAAIDIKEQLKQGNPSYVQYEDLSKKQIQKSLTEERRAREEASSVDQVGY